MRHSNWAPPPAAAPGSSLLRDACSCRPLPSVSVGISPLRRRAGLPEWVCGRAWAGPAPLPA
eukprot:7430189-Alexandrium_andersonii.AAC.1